MLAVLIMFTAALLWSVPLTATFIELVLSICMLFVKWDRVVFVAYITCFVLGPIGEATAIAFGAWQYPMPAFIGVPLWLPFVWGNAGVFIIRLNSFLGHIDR